MEDHLPDSIRILRVVGNARRPRVHHRYSEHRSILVTVVTVTVMVSNFSTPCIPCTLTRK